MNRRSFLTTLGAATAGVATGACATSPRAVSTTGVGATTTSTTTTTTRTSVTPAVGVGPVGLQLYTVRDAMQKSAPETLERVAALGYKEVEFAGYYGMAPGEVRALLGRLGLTSPSSHLGYDLLKGDWQKTVDDAKAIGNEWATIPWLMDNQRPTTVDGWKRLAAELNAGAAVAQAAGLRLAYHNHDFELVQLEGTTPLDILLTNTEPGRVDYEMDVYWVTKAGHDPLAWFAKYPGRWKMLHIKDASAAPERAMRPVGQGTIDWRAVLAQRPTAGVQHIFVEHDSAAEWGGGDPFKSVTASYQYLSTLK